MDGFIMMRLTISFPRFMWSGVSEFKTQVENVSSILRRYPAALIAGAPFPDYLYACGTDHGAGPPDPFGVL